MSLLSTKRTNSPHSATCDRPNKLQKLSQTKARSICKNKKCEGLKEDLELEQHARRQLMIHFSRHVWPENQKPKNKVKLCENSHPKVDVPELQRKYDAVKKQLELYESKYDSNVTSANTNGEKTNDDMDLADPLSDDEVDSRLHQATSYDTKSIAKPVNNMALPESETNTDGTVADVALDNTNNAGQHYTKSNDVASSQRTIQDLKYKLEQLAEQKLQLETKGCPKCMQVLQQMTSQCTQLAEAKLSAAKLEKLNETLNEALQGLQDKSTVHHLKKEISCLKDDLSDMRKQRNRSEDDYRAMKEKRKHVENDLRKALEAEDALKAECERLRTRYSKSRSPSAIIPSSSVSLSPSHQPNQVSASPSMSSTTSSISSQNPGGMTNEQLQKYNALKDKFNSLLKTWEDLKQKHNILKTSYTNLRKSYTDLQQRHKNETELANACVRELESEHKNAMDEQKNKITLYETALAEKGASYEELLQQLDVDAENTSADHDSDEDMSPRKMGEMILGL